MNIKKGLAGSMGLLLMIFSSGQNALAEDNIIYGDADGNGIISGEDAAFILQKLMDKSFVLPIEQKTADYMKYIDVNADNALTSLDSAYVIQKVLDSSFIMPAELSNGNIVKLNLTDTGWAYPNVAYWSLADYPKNTEQNYAVTLYKNGIQQGEYSLTVTADEASVGYGETNNGRIGAHIDFTHIIKEDVKAEYTFSVKAVGDGTKTSDSDVILNDVPYIYNDYALNTPAVSVSSENTVQIKLFNTGSIPYSWNYFMNNDNLSLTSNATDNNYHSDYDFVYSIAGGGICERYNFKPVKPGEVNIRFEFVSMLGETDSSKVKTVKLKVNQDLSVEIIE